MQQGRSRQAAKADDLRLDARQASLGRSVDRIKELLDEAKGQCYQPQANGSTVAKMS